MTTLYAGETGWLLLSDALDRAVAGDGTQLVVLADTYLSRAEDGSYAHGIETNNAVNCLDKPIPDTATLEREAARFTRESPRFGNAALTVSCVRDWRPAARDGLPRPQARRHMGSAPPHPATALRLVRHVAEQIGSGVLLTYEGEATPRTGAAFRASSRPSTPTSSTRRCRPQARAARTACSARSSRRRCRCALCLRRADRQLAIVGCGALGSPDTRRRASRASPPTQTPWFMKYAKSASVGRVP